METEELKYDPVERVVWIPIDELVVDECNIRGGAWDYDKTLVRSIERVGVEQPLLVRPFEGNDEHGAKWGIVAGSRRYNAALDAGLSRLPCRIKELNDEEAMLHSMEENRNRQPTAKWRDIDFVGQVIDRLRERGLSKSSAMSRVLDHVGMSRPTVDRYYRLSRLDRLVKGLLREAEDRNREQREVIRLLFPSVPMDPIDLLTADLVEKYFSGRPPTEQVKLAVELDGYPVDYREDIAKRLANNPEITVEEAAGESIRKTGESRVIHFQEEVYEGLVRACLDRQTRLSNLVQKVLERWLRRNDYLRMI